MNARQYFQISRAIMPLVAASALAACGIDLESYGEPFFNLARDASVRDAAEDEPADNAGRSAEGSRAGTAAPGHTAAGSGAQPRDAGALDAGDAEDAGVDGEGNAGAGGGFAAGSGGQAGHTGHAGHAGTTGAAGHSAGAGGSTPAAVSFSDIYTGIIAAGCSCHNGGAGGLDLSTRTIAYGSLVSAPSTSCFGELRVVPGDAQASVLFHSLAHTSLGFCEVPTMPRNSAQLSDAQLAALQAWIDAGARDD